MSDITWPRSGLSIVRPRVSTALAAIAILMVVGVFHVWLRMEVTRCEYDVSTLEKNIRAEEYEFKTLEVALGKLTNPRQLQRVATSQLGLREPGADQVITVK
ncbi:MAG: hypothetical protein C0620_00645 [Desulfuromonas sp.]|nr:MAG: hypothetical protein C0620_00645 [Desulfuromonas sp.]